MNKPSPVNPPELRSTFVAASSMPWQRTEFDGIEMKILYKDDATEERETEYREKFAHPYLAAARGYLDDIIDPRDTRPRLIEALATLATKRDRNPPKKHGNIPL